ncbi:MAG: FKBP-type peptidyl-prolyl cis-trans isomerase [Gammaproteobacteria bacterium]
MSNGKLIGGLVLGAVAGAGITAAVMKQGAPAADEALVLESLQQRSSYVIGTDIGGRFGAQELDIDVAALSAGITDAMAGNDPQLSEEDAKAALAAFVEQQQAAMAERQQAAQAENAILAEQNMAIGTAFLEANKVKEGVVTTDSGLQYKIIEAGDGAKPTADDIVQVHYRGTLIDGAEFDSSYARGEPAEFQVGGVIKGWTEALQLMSEGAKWELYIPADLAYGERGAGQDIGPNSVLVFEVELLKAGS